MDKKEVSGGLSRLKRIPQRVRRDLRMIALLRNWPQALWSEANGNSLRTFELRNGVVLSGPDTLRLAFLFDEIWIQKLYSPSGFEIRPGDAVVDIGANVGIFTGYAASVMPRVKVYAYEPFPEAVDWLNKNVRDSRLSNVRVYAQAVAGTRGPRPLHLSTSGSIFHSLVRADSGGDISVPCVTLSDVLAENEIDRCDLLKLDCEGSEHEILRSSAPDTLRRVKRIVGEYHVGSETETGEELCRFLESRSFRINHFERMDETCGMFAATNTSG